MDGGQMTRLPYIKDWVLFERVELRKAEELLREYNDFFMYNQSQYNDIRNIARPTVDDQVCSGVDDETCDKTEELIKASAEHNAKMAVEHFRKLFGSKDFAESSLIGCEIAWDDLQQILMEEYKKKTSAQHSAMNEVSLRVLTIVSTLLFAEYLLSKLLKMHKLGEGEKIELHNQKIEGAVGLVKNFFVDFIAELANNPNIRVPEYSKSKNALGKLKTVDAVIDFCEANFRI